MDYSGVDWPVSVEASRSLLAVGQCVPLDRGSRMAQLYANTWLHTKREHTSK